MRAFSDSNNSTYEKKSTISTILILVIITIAMTIIGASCNFVLYSLQSGGVFEQLPCRGLRIAWESPAFAGALHRP